MLKKYTNAWFHILTNETNISNIQINEPNNLRFEIKIRNTPLEFMVAQTENSFDLFQINHTRFAPNYPLVNPPMAFENGITTRYTGDEVSLQLLDWVETVVHEYFLEQELPDFWKQSKAYSVFSNSPSIPEEELLPFSSQEKASIKEGLKSFEVLLIENFNPVEEQLKTITERLDYLSASVDRLSRFDWKAQALSTLISIAINLGVDTETGNKLLLMFQQALVHIAKYLPPSVHLGH